MINQELLQKYSIFIGSKSNPSDIAKHINKDGNKIFYKNIKFNDKKILNNYINELKARRL